MDNEEITNKEISREDIEAAEACGLNKVRKYGLARFELIAVAMKDNARKCQALLEFAQELKAHNIPCKVEEKARVIALYGRVE